MLQYVELVDDQSGERVRVGLLGDFAATIVDRAGKEFVAAMLQELGSVALVMTKAQFAKKADAAFDRIEVHMKTRTSSIVDALVQQVRDRQRIAP